MEVKNNMIIVAIVAIVAIVGLVILIANVGNKQTCSAGTSTNYVGAATGVLDLNLKTLIDGGFIDPTSNSNELVLQKGVSANVKGTILYLDKPGGETIAADDYNSRIAIPCECLEGCTSYCHIDFIRGRGPYCNGRCSGGEECPPSVCGWGTPFAR